MEATYPTHADVATFIPSPILSDRNQSSTHITSTIGRPKRYPNGSPKTKPMKPPTSFPANALRNKNTNKPSKGPSRRKIRNRFMPRPTLSANLITHRALKVKRSSVTGSSMQRRHGRRDERGTMRLPSSRAPRIPPVRAARGLTCHSLRLRRHHHLVSHCRENDRVRQARNWKLPDRPSSCPWLASHAARRSARVMFLRDLMLQTRCFACYTLRKRGRC